MFSGNPPKLLFKTRGGVLFRLLFKTPLGGGSRRCPGTQTFWNPGGGGPTEGRHFSHFSSVVVSNWSKIFRLRRPFEGVPKIKKKPVPVEGRHKSRFPSVFYQRGPKKFLAAPEIGHFVTQGGGSRSGQPLGVQKLKISLTPTYEIRRGSYS